MDFEENLDFEKVLRNKGKCCITDKPLKDSKYLNVVQLHIKAKYEFPVWGNFLSGESNMAVAIVHDNAIVKGKFIDKVKYAIEFSDGEIIYHTIPTCRICGCTEEDACIHPKHGNCWWVEPDLCSHCKNWPGESKRYSELKKS